MKYEILKQLVLKEVCSRTKVTLGFSLIAKRKLQVQLESCLVVGLSTKQYSERTKESWIVAIVYLCQYLITITYYYWHSIPINCGSFFKVCTCIT